MKHRKHKKRCCFEYRFERIVDRDTVKHDLADQTLRFDYADRDRLHYSGTLAQTKDYDALCEQHSVEIRKEAREKARQARLGI